MTTREKILAEAARKPAIKSSDLVKKLGIARQNITAQLKKLVEDGLLVRVGSTRSAVYHRPKKVPNKTPVELRIIKKLKGLEEDKVFAEIVRKLSLNQKLNKNAFSIFSYAFTEMLNNAIDHSVSLKCSIVVSFEKGKVTFEVRDLGVGVFFKVRKKFRLKDEFEGLEHVLKGKQTTAPTAHSGEGIFFTSRIADLFILRSHQLKLRIDNNAKDTFISQEKNIRGTSVHFVISKNTKKSLATLFREHTNSDFVFDRADQRIKVAAFGGGLSRSEAKRLLNGLDKFDRLTFDFRGIKEIGQGFADELFRVYARAHPDKTIDYINANRAVEFMIRRAIKAS